MATRSQTRSIEIEAPPDAVCQLLDDPRDIPRWAPAFADAIRGDARSGWRVSKDGEEFALRVVAGADTGTVDYLRETAPGREGGAYLRAVPRPGSGTVVVMTLPVPAGADPTVVSVALEEELAALARLAEGR